MDQRKWSQTTLRCDRLSRKDLHGLCTRSQADSRPRWHRYSSRWIPNPLPRSPRRTPRDSNENSEDTLQDKDRLGNETCTLIAIVKLRDQMIRFLPGCKFLPPTRMDGKAVAGLQAKPLTWIAEGGDFLTAYQELHKQVVG